MAGKKKSSMTETDILDCMKRVANGKAGYRNEPIFMPQGGTCYAFCSADDLHKQRDWRADGYRWRQYGAKSIKVGDKVLKKTYFHVYTAPKQISGEFQRMAHECSDYPHIVVVLYKGDSSIAGSFPHGNRRRDSKPYIMTRPSIISKCRKSVGDPSAVFEEMVAAADCETPQYPVSIPRDPVQIQNLQKSMRQTQKRLCETLCDIQSIACDATFSYDVNIDPDLVVTIFNIQLLEHFSTFLCHLNSTELLDLMFTSIIDFEDFTVSALFHQNTDITTLAFPVMFYIHKNESNLSKRTILGLACKRILKLKNFKNVKLDLGKDHTSAELLNMISETQVKSFRTIARRLQDWEESPNAAVANLQSNAFELYKMSLHYANTATGGELNMERYLSNAQFRDVFGGKNADMNTLDAPLSKRLKKDSSLFENSILHDGNKQSPTNSYRSSVSDTIIEEARSINPSNIHHSMRNRSFVVQDGSVEEEVKLFPEPQCTCKDSNVPCRHIVACQISLGMRIRVEGKKGTDKSLGEKNKIKSDNSRDQIRQVFQFGLDSEDNCLDDGIVMDISKEITIVGELSE